ncbi:MULTISPECIES: GIY-YIG nuclease family protein [unclassified Bacillus (in: firmicutes)]|uniref:GIY-YIG nuclease family protein n=1 Tax=Bacillaceae TaxID=186817 RepID=UPI000BF0E3BB|nr:MULTISPECIES: GIY-YIG nuclease family protein [unclassified Bacillus (in: firmicutes)]PEJ59553.1 LuxR family transcriptional regulator [Bacillus sp. AFS002410]PEL13618.1 LuxR family transcriptional regulator [Bacillus sp. AFS017336]QKE74918.1 GIY-YIG nuclease family protein [Arthrobacter citreus]
MSRKKELKMQYKETKVQAGIYQIRNVKNEKIFIVSTKNLKTINGKKFELEAGSCTNQALQQEWNEYGKESFVFEELEVLKEEDISPLGIKGDLKKLEEKWLEKLQPFGERGYNSFNGKGDQA